MNEKLKMKDIEISTLRNELNEKQLKSSALSVVNADLEETLKMKDKKWNDYNSFCKKTLNDMRLEMKKQRETSQNLLESKNVEISKLTETHEKITEEKDEKIKING